MKDVNFGSEIRIQKFYIKRQLCKLTEVSLELPNYFNVTYI